MPGTFYAASCAFADVNDCINGSGANTCHSGSPAGPQATHTAVDGDIVILPVCTNTTVSAACPSTGATSNTWGCNQTNGANNQQLQVNAAVTIMGQDSPGGNDCLTFNPAASTNCGSYQTVLIDNNWKGATGFGSLFRLNSASNAAWRLSGITIRGSSNDSGLNGAHILISSNSHAMRVDHMTSDEDEYAGGGCASFGDQWAQSDGDLWGVVDHNVSRSCRRHGWFGFGEHFGSSSATLGDTSWSTPESMGMPGFPANQYNAATGTCGGNGSVPCQAALIFENNTFVQDVNNTGSNPLACERSARCVNRFNSLASNGTHGYEQNAQGMRHWEHYGNTYSTSTTTAFCAFCQNGTCASCNGVDAIDVRSGLGMVFENQILATGVFTYDPSMVRWEYYRCNNCGNTIAPPNAPWGSDCNGSTAPGFASGSWDYVVGFPGTNPAPTPCIGTIGRGQGNLINRSVAAWPNNKLLGNYAWKNNNAGTIDAPASTGGKQGSPQQYFVNLDYYDGTASFNGTSGVGYGLLSAIPATCTVNGPSQDGQFSGVAYWATDQGNWNQSSVKFWDNTNQGILYKCFTDTQKAALPAGTSCVTKGANPNNWCQWYEPFTYPHPLIGGGTPIVAAPNISPNGGTFSVPQMITITDTTGGATICYTTDGSTPTANGGGVCTHGTTYSGSFIISSSETIQAIGSESGFNDSSVSSANFTFVIPSFGLSGGTSMVLGITQGWKITRY